MAEHHVVDAGGVRLAYDVWGAADAPPLVLLHALGENAADWAQVAPVLAHGGRPHRVYALDLRGHGRSDWPGTYSLGLMRDDVVAFLDAAGLDRVDLIGHSMGGVVAYLLAQEHPRRVNRLVLEDAPAPLPREKTAPTRPEGELTFDWDMVLAVRGEIDAPPPAWLERLDRITARTLALAGGPTSHVPHTGLVELTRRVPDARLATIPVGHLIHHEAPDAFTAAVSAFLSHQPG